MSWHAISRPHMPWACRLRNPEEIRSAFVSAGVDLEAPLVASCGTGVTASVLALALEQLSPQPKVCQLVL